MLKFILSICIIATSFSAHSQEALRTKHYNVNSKSVAVSGYDVVAYFTLNKAVKGDKNYAVNAEGVFYYFSSRENKELFLRNWRNYEPQYGGWCAYAMGSYGSKVEIDPQTFKIVNGKLYLFYHSWTNNTLTKWNRDEDHLRNRANVNWTNIFR